MARYVDVAPGTQGDLRTALSEYAELTDDDPAFADSQLGVAMYDLMVCCGAGEPLPSRYHGTEMVCREAVQGKAEEADADFPVANCCKRGRWSQGQRFPDALNDLE